MEQLPASELRRLREKLFSRSFTMPGVQPKTGAELAKTLPNRFHLDPAEADVLSAEMSRSGKSLPQPSEWE